ncbi:MAG: ZIP family metal transporter [Clostridium sp.]|nr:ZIP family metal transporter [Clostridium sp.]
MILILIVAIAVGISTALGSLIGLLFQGLPHKYNDILLGFAAGVMLAAAILGLIIPSVEMVGKYGLWLVGLAIFMGAVFLSFMDKLTPHLHYLSGVEIEKHGYNESIDKVLLFVLAIAIHNFPEGIAAGVGFGAENIGGAMTVAIGISLQNIPEGLVIIPPMLSAGISKKRAFLIGSGTGLMGFIGTFVGYYASSISQKFLPFALAFAGGVMLYIISDEMIPDTHSHGYEKGATYSLLFGFVLMLFIDTYIS